MVFRTVVADHWQSLPGGSILASAGLMLAFVAHTMEEPMIRKWTLPLIAALAAIFFFSGAALAVPSCPGPDDSKKTVKADKKKQKKGDDAFVPTSTDCPGPDDGKKTVKSNKKKKKDDAFTPTSTACPGPDDCKKTVKSDKKKKKKGGDA